MTQCSVLILSDSHSYKGIEFFDDLPKIPDEIWHAGDIGNIEVLDRLKEFNVPVRAVSGNIDDVTVRNECPEYLSFQIQGLQVLMIHIGGRPGKYNPRATELIRAVKPDLFICGHSHICRAEWDKKYDMMYINPGAIGKHGFHKFRTCLLLEIENGKPKTLKVLEYKR